MSKVLMLMLGSVCLIGCELSDADRCEEGTTWEPTQKACKKNEILDGQISQKDAAVATSDGTPSGWDKPCSATSECAGFSDVDHCAYDPIKNVGACTKKDCTKGSCPSTHTCCTGCPTTPSAFCVNNNNVTQAKTYCNCE